MKRIRKSVFIKDDIAGNVEFAYCYIETPISFMRRTIGYESTSF